MLLTDIIEDYNLSQTEVFAKLHDLKETDYSAYIALIYQNEFGELNVFDDGVNSFLSLFKSKESKNESDTVSQEFVAVLDALKSEISISNKRYNLLFEDYLKLSKQLQFANDQLLNLVTTQQTLIKEQIKAVETRDPRNLAKRLVQLDDEELENKLRKQDDEDELYLF